MRITIKYIISVLLILSFVLSITMYFDIHVCNDIDILSDYSAKIDKFIQSGDPDNAYKIYKQMDKDWNVIKERWCLIINHTLIKEVDVSITSMGHYIKNTLFDDALVERHKLLRLFYAVKNLDKIMPSNIF